MGAYFPLLETDPDGNCYRSLVYTTVVALFHWSEAYGKEVMAVTAPYFQKNASQLDIKLGKSYMYVQNVLIVRAKLWCLRFINKPHFLDDKKPLLTGRLELFANVKFNERSMVRPNLSRFHAVDIR